MHYVKNADIKIKHTLSQIEKKLKVSSMFKFSILGDV